MSIGTGIFLSCIFLGLIYLFVKTKNTWNWKKITIISISTPIILIICFFSWISISDYLEARPRIITKLENVSLNERISAARFKIPDLNPVAKIEGDDPEVDNYFNGKIWISSKKNIIISVSRTCNENYDYFSVNAIQCGQSGDDIMQSFGASNVEILCRVPDKDEEISKKYSHQVRVYDVKRYGVRYHLLLNKVHAFTIFNPDQFSRSKWKQCD